MKKSVLFSAILSAALATGFAFAPAAYADDMKKDTKKEEKMSKDSGMKKEDSMDKNTSMSKDSGMKK
jgi:pentapeptide MXKDX repeat protein